MGFILGAMRRGLAEAGGVAEQVGIRALQSELDGMRQERLQELKAKTDRETHRVNATTDLEMLPQKSAAETAALKDREEALRPGKVETARQTEALKPHVVAPGSSVLQDGKITATAPVKELPSEQAEYYTAAAARLNAEADAIRGGMKYRDRSAPKVDLPEVTVTKDESMGTFLTDKRTGAIGILTPGTPGKPAEKNWLFPDKPAESGTAPTVQWQYNGQPLKGGLADLYPAMRGRVGGSGEVSSAAPAGWDNSTGDVILNGEKIGTAKSEDEAKNLLRGRRQNPKKDKPQPDEGSSGDYSPAPARSTGVDQAGASLDQARNATREAQSMLQRYGTVRQRQDPDGFAKAKALVQERKAAEREAEAAYQRLVGDAGGAARFSVR